MSGQKDEYEILAEKAERGELKAAPGTVRRRKSGDDSGLEWFTADSDFSDFDELVKVSRPGRPRVDSGPSQGASPVVRTRVSQSLKDRLKEIADMLEKTESELVREAVAMYVEQHDKRLAA